MDHDEGRSRPPWPPNQLEPLPPAHGHNPRILHSWARRTGFRSTVSGESLSTPSEVEIGNAEIAGRPPSRVDQVQPFPRSQLDRKRENGNAKVHDPMASIGLPPLPPPPPIPIERRRESESKILQNAGQFRQESSGVYRDSEADLMSESQDADEVLMAKQSHMKYALRDKPGLVPLILYGIQHYFSMAGSIVLLPLVIVPAMGGSDDDTARVISTVLLVSGLTTLLHTSFGSRLPLVQGSSFVYLAPALVIINSKEFLSLGLDRFKETMRELQGAVISASLVQMLIGYSGLMRLMLRLINPVVVAPTVSAVGLAFYTYGFPVVGSCPEVGIPQILVVILLALYLRKINIFGHRVFQIYAVPLSLGIIWAYAFLLTAGGAYNFKGCNMNVPVSNIVSAQCRKHVYTMQHCRTDTSNALITSSWFRVPYPFQWGVPTFHWKTAGVMIAASFIASVDSVGTYHAASLLVASKAPSPGVVSRAIGLEGLTSALAGIWGTGMGATTLTENVHTIAVTKIGSRRAVEFGACILILISFIGKVGGLIASIPRVIVAALLCLMWTLLTALGLSNLRYSETGSSRNVLIVGLSLFMSFSLPVYFQHYGRLALVAILPSYFQPYMVPSHGPVRTGMLGLDFFLNSILSMNMVIAFLVAITLDNTVPGGRQERGSYIWSNSTTTKNDLNIVKDYGLPDRVARLFRWARWVGL